jgi:AraC family transcriptional regulator
MSVSEYAQRLNRVIDHIDRHLDEPLELDTLADVAHFSRYHFHRVFAAWIGETFGDYLRRRRLEVAAMKMIVQPELSVLEVALSVGFGSGEAFARAFKTRFGCTPTAWRDTMPGRWAAEGEAARQRRLGNGNSGQDHRNFDQAGTGGERHNGGSITSNKESNMQVAIVDMPAAKVAYMRHIGPYGPQLGEFWRNDFLPWVEAHDLGGQVRYGVGYDDPSITAPEKCRYDACVEVPASFTAQGKIGVMTLPGGRYAVTRFRGDPRTIGDAWMEFFGAWLPKSGYQPDERPCFEYYPVDSEYDGKTGVFSCDLCIPVRAL